MPAALALAACLLVSANADLESGPKPGAAVPELKAFGVAGDVQGKEADFAAERKDKPTVYVFVQAAEGGVPVGGRPAARFLKGLDAEAAKVDDAAVVAVWLGDKAFAKHKDYLPRIQKSLGFGSTQLAAFDGPKDGPEGWAVNADADLTVVVARKGKVVKSFALVSVSDTEVAAVVKELKGAGKDK